MYLNMLISVSECKPSMVEFWDTDKESFTLMLFWNLTIYIILNYTRTKIEKCLEAFNVDNAYKIMDFEVADC